MARAISDLVSWYHASHQMNSAFRRQAIVWFPFTYQSAVFRQLNCQIVQQWISDDAISLSYRPSRGQYDGDDYAVICQDFLAVWCHSVNACRCIDGCLMRSKASNGYTWFCVDDKPVPASKYFLLWRQRHAFSSVNVKLYLAMRSMHRLDNIGRYAGHRRAHECRPVNAWCSCQLASCHFAGVDFR